MKTKWLNFLYKIIAFSFIFSFLISYQSIAESYFTLKSYDIAFAIEKTQIISHIEDYSLLRNILKAEDEFIKFKDFTNTLLNSKENHFSADNVLKM